MRTVLDYDDNPPDSGPIRRPRVADEVTRRLSLAIRHGIYQAGDYLPSERDLMARFGVGRPAVREALSTLRKLGLVAVNSGMRSQVIKPDGKAVISQLSGVVQHLLADEDAVRQMQHVRSLFETALARDAALFASEDDIRALKQALDRNRAAIGKRNFIETDIGFHFAIAERTKNPMIVQIHDAMAAWLRDQRLVTLTIRGLAQISCDEHEAIYEAIAAHDADRAETLMRSHLEHVARNYWTALRKQM
jgi:GntR family transcriptional repressor for pyruvate dehydrogenase complex